MRALLNKVVFGGKSVEDRVKMRRARVLEVRPDRSVVLSVGSGTRGGNRLTVKSDAIYTGDPRGRGGPRKDDTCLLGWVNGRADDPVIFGFNSGSNREHDFFEHPDDRRHTLPGGGQVNISGDDGSVDASIAGDLTVKVGDEETEYADGLEPNVYYSGVGSAVLKFARRFVVRAATTVLRATTKLVLESADAGLIKIGGLLIIDTTTTDMRGTDLKAAYATVLVESASVDLGGAGGPAVARVGDRVEVPIKYTSTDSDGDSFTVDTTAVGEIVEGSDAVRAID